MKMLLEEGHDPYELVLSKWADILTLLELGYDPRRIEFGAENCAFCEIYSDDESQSCQGCPIYKLTRVPFCEDTPFEEFEDAIWFCRDQCEKRPCAIHECDNYHDLIDLAKEEFEFLRKIKNSNS